MRMPMNIQHSTCNAQRPRRWPARGTVGYSTLNVESSMFLFLTASALSLSAQSATNALPALAPAYGKIPPTFWEQHGTAMLIGGLVLVVLAALLIWRFLQPKPAVVLPPEVLAREALSKLQGRPEDGKTLSEVSQILRHYIGTAFELPNGELTTAEFCAVIADNEPMGSELVQTIASFLRECDVRKFSPANAVAPLNAVPRALELVSLVEQRRTESAVKTSTAK